MKYILPDTNVFLHYRHYTEFPWESVVGDSEVTLVITSALLGELDELKWKGSSAKIKERAQRIGRQLFTAVSAGSPRKIGDGLWLDLNVEEASISIDFSAHGLSRQSQDDVHVATMLAYGLKHADRETVFVSGDTNQILKLRVRNLAAVLAPDEARLPVDPDPVQVENLELKREIGRLTARRPDLKLTFVEGGTRKLILVSPVTVKSESWIEDRLERERSTRTYRPPSKDDVGLGIIASVLGDPDGGDVLRYEKRLKDYLVDFEAALRAKSLYDAAYSLTGVLPLQLGNEGTEVAEDIDIRLSVPNYVHIGTKAPIPAKSDPPEPPKWPQPRLLGGVDLDMFDAPRRQSSLFSIPEFVRDRKPPRVWIKDIDSGCLIHVDRLKHHEADLLPEPAFWFDRPADVKGFTLSVRITSATLLDALELKLHVQVKPDESPEGAA
jgi:hypothetical protein